MKILLVHNRYRSSIPGGEDRVVDQEAAALLAAGHTVERFERASDSIDQRSLLGKALVPVEVFWSEGTRQSLSRTLAAFNPDVMHVHNTFPLLSPSVLYAGKAQGIPMVATIHNYRLLCPSGDLFRNGSVCHECVGRAPFPAIRYRCYRGSALATLPLAAGIVAHRRAWRSKVSAYVFLSERQRDSFSDEGLPPERVFVKPNMVTDPLRVDSVPEDIAVYAGRLSDAKGVRFLLEAWDHYLQIRPKPGLRLVIAGSGPLEGEVRAWVAQSTSAECTGMLSRDACAALLGRARVVIVPSLWEETFGLVAVEAMAAGVPPVVPSIGSFVELIGDGKDGVTFPPGDASALARILVDVTSHPRRYVALGRAARQTYERRYTPEANVVELERIYRFAVDHPAR